MLLEAHGIRAYVDGLGLDVYEILKKSPEYLRNPEILERAFRSVVPVKVQQRDLVLKKP
jgi:putative mRNA 3-end processing factor